MQLLRYVIVVNVFTPIRAIMLRCLVPLAAEKHSINNFYSANMICCVANKAKITADAALGVHPISKCFIGRNQSGGS